MDLYIYRLRDFNNCDDESNSEAHLLESRLTSVVPMIFGYFHFGLNYIEVYPYEYTGYLARPYTIFNDECQILDKEFVLAFPYKDKKFAQSIASQCLERLGYLVAAKAVKQNQVCRLKVMEFGISRDDMNYAKKWDKKFVQSLLDKRFDKKKE